MAVKVKDKSDLTLLADLLDERLDGVHLGTIKVLFCGIPLSVEVLTREVCPVVAKDHTIGIDHWNHIDHIIFQEEICLL